MEPWYPSKDGHLVALHISCFLVSHAQSTTVEVVLIVMSKGY